MSEELPWYKREMLPEVCLRLRMACNGSADPIPDEEVDTVCAYLQERVDNWKPTTASTKTTEVLDGTVRLMVLATLAEVGERRSR